MLHLYLYRKKAAIGFIPILLVLYGCTGTLSLISLPATAFNVGSLVYQSIENSEVSIAVREGLTKESLGPITRFAIFMGKESRVRPYGRIGDPGAVVADNLAMELVRCGYHVYDSEDIARAKSLKIEEIDQATALHAARSLGAEVIVTGHVTAGRNGSLGIAGAGRLTTVIESVSLKITEVEKGETLMRMTIRYKIGQAPPIVGEGIALIVKAKMSDPQTDIERLLENKKTIERAREEDIQA